MSTPDPGTASTPGGDDDLALWRAADAVLDQLLRLEASEREAALCAMALPPDLERCVQRLLRADSDAQAEPTALAHPLDASLRGRRLGRWVLEDELGRGGMAVVYRARSLEPPHLQAAVKLFPLVSRADGIERFRREQAILARLNYPHIAALIDAGTADDGSLWPAMRLLVNGEPIDRWCSARWIGLRGRVERMLDVCDAVAYAHRSLVVHRNIKPLNVLVDDSGHVNLLDFGIAQLTEDAVDAEATATRWRALSPAYAAPEQFAGGPATTAMDVFGLGALLYTLLCGRPPRSGPDVSAPITQPSLRRADIEPGEVQERSLPPVEVLRGDLDAIVLKALDYDPAWRYPSVDALADDLRRWLDGRAVQARADPAVSLQSHAQAQLAAVCAGPGRGIGVVDRQRDRAGARGRRRACAAGRRARPRRSRSRPRSRRRAARLPAGRVRDPDARAPARGAAEYRDAA